MLFRRFNTVDKKLEIKLREIQRLKRENYVGTKTAWSHLDRIAALHENPRKVSETINERLTRQGNVHYLATPERIVGIGYYFPRFFQEVEISKEGELTGDEIERSLNLSKTPLYSTIDLISGKKKYRNIEKLTDYLTPLFSRCQYKGMNNEGFAIHAINYPEELKKLDKPSIEGVLKQVFLSNWDQLLSTKNFIKLESIIRENIFRGEIKIKDRVKLMINDLVDHRLENRREILTDILYGWLYDDLFEDDKDPYDTLRDEYKERLEENRKRLERLKGQHSPEIIIDNEKKSIEINEFILRVIAPERNFISRYLKRKPSK